MTWRDKFKVHPAADVFPMMSDGELVKLGEDIKAHGLESKITFFVESSACDDPVLADGRNRLEAMEVAGVELEDRHTDYIAGVSAEDQVAYIISKNIHRRHLTKQQQADLIVAAIKAGEKLDRAEPVSGRVESSAPQAAKTARERLIADYCKGGRGKKNPVKEKAVAAGKQLEISESTIKRAIAKAEGREPAPKPVVGDENWKALVKEGKECVARIRSAERGSVPEPKMIAGPRLKTKPKLTTHVGIDAARRYYLEQCEDPDVDLDAEQEIIIDGLREIAGKRAMARQSAKDDLGDIPACLDRRVRP